MKFIAWLKRLFRKKPKAQVPSPQPQRPAPEKPVATPRYGKGWHPDFDRLILESKLVLPPLPASKPAFFYALAVAESGLDPETVFREPQSIGGMLSIGLLQLSLGDVKNYKAYDLGIETEDDLKDPIKNLKLGLVILSKLYSQDTSKTVYECGGRYWSTLRWDKYWPGKSQAGYQRFLKALSNAEQQNPVKAPEDKDTKTEEPQWLVAARKELGTKEVQGSGNNPRIVAYHAETSLGPSDDSISWCSSFVNWCMKQAGIKGTKSAAARSWLQWGKAVSNPEPGDVVIFWRESPSSWKGHVALFLKDDGSYVTVLGGNQSDSVTIARYPKSQLLGYRRPITT